MPVVCVKMNLHIRQSLAEVVVLCAIYIERLIEQALETPSLSNGFMWRCEHWGLRLRPTPF